MGLVYWSQNPFRTNSSNTSSITIKSIEQKLAIKEENKAIQSCNNPCLKLFIQQVIKDLLQTNSSRTSVIPDNLPEESSKALQDMKNGKM